MGKSQKGVLIFSLTGMTLSRSLGLVAVGGVVGGAAHKDRAAVSRVMRRTPATGLTLVLEAGQISWF